MGNQFDMITGFTGKVLCIQLILFIPSKIYKLDKIGVLRKIVLRLITYRANDVLGKIITDSQRIKKLPTVLGRHW